MTWITNLLQRITAGMTRHRGLVALVAGITLAGIIGLILTSSSDDPEVVEAVLPAVSVTTAGELATRNTVSLVGNVRALSEAAVTAERGGRVTSVRVELGETVVAGEILVTLENAAEAAAVLQAEGSYDSARAAAAQSNVGVDEAANGLSAAKNNAIATMRTAYSTADSVVRANIDQFFSNPDGYVPGLRISGEGNTAATNEARVKFQTLLPTWEQRVNGLSVSSDFSTEIAYNQHQLSELISFVSLFINIFNEQDGSNKYTESEIANFSTSFGSIRNNLISLQSQLDSASSAIANANDAITRARLAGSGGQNSAADAQVKTALGSLRAAQANYAKTILRASVSGTVNELPVRTGDFIAQQTKVAEVANNNALEIVTYASDAELFALQPGDTVTINRQYEGIITTIAPAVDTQTGKTEVRIATDNAAIKNGDTVRITANVTETDIEENTIRVPLSAVKFEREDGYMFTVIGGVLERFPVELGNVFGGEVEILSGLTNTEIFVVDARGLREGELVQIAI